MSPVASSLPHVAFIASYQDGRLDQISARSTFWRDARQRLDQIGNRITRQPTAAGSKPHWAQRVPPTTEDEAQQRQADEGVQRVGRNRENSGDAAPISQTTGTAGVDHARPDELLVVRR